MIAQVYGAGIGFLLIGIFYLIAVRPWEKHETKTYPLYVIRKVVRNDGSERYVVLVNCYEGLTDEYYELKGLFGKPAMYTEAEHAEKAARHHFAHKTKTTEDVVSLAREAL
jgi:hypothetical protein